MGPFCLLPFSSIVYAKSDAYLHIDKEWMHCLNNNSCRKFQLAHFEVEVWRLSVLEARETHLLPNNCKLEVRVIFLS